MDRTKPAGILMPALFNPSEASHLEGHSSLVHFTGTADITPTQILNPYVLPTSKPWAAVCLHPYLQQFFQALDQTPWAGWRPSQAALETAAAAELIGLVRRLEISNGQHCWQFESERFLLNVARLLTAGLVTESDPPPTGPPILASHLRPVELPAAAEADFVKAEKEGQPPADPIQQAATDADNSEELEAFHRSIGGGIVMLQTGLGYRFTSGWLDRLVVHWEEHVVPLLLPGGVGSR